MCWDWKSPRPDERAARLRKAKKAPSKNNNNNALQNLRPFPPPKKENRERGGGERTRATISAQKARRWDFFPYFRLPARGAIPGRRSRHRLLPLSSGEHGCSRRLLGREGKAPFAAVFSASRCLSFPRLWGETFSSPPPPSRAVSSGLPRLCKEAHEGEALETDSPHLLAGLRISAYLHRRRRWLVPGLSGGGAGEGRRNFFAVKLPLSRAANRGSPAERRKIYCRAKARRCELCKTFVAAAGWEKGGRKSGSIPGNEIVTRDPKFSKRVSKLAQIDPPTTVCNPFSLFAPLALDFIRSLSPASF